jgi:hypothetical protein
MKSSAYLLASLALCASAQAVVVDFSGASDFANNFRLLPFSSGHTIAQTGSVLTVTGNNVNTTAVAYIYDTTPADATPGTQNSFSLQVGESISVSLDIGNISANNAGSSIGFYFASPTAPGSPGNFLALMNINNSGANEQFRFANNATLSNSSPNGSAFSAGSPSLADTGVTLSDPIFRTVTATYLLNSATSVTMTLASGAITSSVTFNSVTAFSDVAVAFRMSPVAGTPRRTMEIDNFDVTVIPEPSTYALLAGAAGLGLALRRRFKAS